jgi:hypothetical protein
MEGKTMAVMNYRTQDGLADYAFSIEFQSDVGWRSYIIFRFSRQGHGDNPQLPYQSIDHNGSRYVDWSVKIDSLGDSKTVTEFWAELVQHYHRVKEQRRDNVEVPKGPRRLERLRKEVT